MIEKIKNATILEKTVRPGNAKILKRLGFAPRSQSFAFVALPQYAQSVRYPDSFTLRPSANPQVQDDRHAFTLAEGATHVARQHNKRIAAFTLAEVLITLGIIGVVAAMTMPSLIQKYQEKVTINKLKKMYSTLSQAYTMYGINNELEIQPFDQEGATAVFNMLKPYLKIAKDCGAKGDGCIAESYLFFDKHASNYYSNSNWYYKIVLADGSALILRGGNGSNATAEIFYDINGKLPPNTWGVDLFEFDFFTTGKVAPCGVEQNFNDCLKNGWSCTAWIIANENMDYMHCPEKLSWDGKHKCSD